MTNTFKMISIIIPIYNVQDYIIKCLESVGAQTYEGLMECILVDDCGNDDSVLLAEQFIASYKGRVEFRMIHHDHNRGQSAARNTGMEIARGEFIGFVDSDDWIEPSMYEELYAYLSNDPQALFVTSGIIAEFPKGPEYGHANTDKYEDGGIIELYHFLELLLATKTNHSCWNKLYRKDFFKVPFREGIISEDLLFLYDNCKSLIGKDVHILTTPKAYYHYTIRPGSSMNQDTQSPKQWYVDYLVAMTYVLDECQHTNPDLYGIQLKRFTSVFGHHFYEIVNNKSLPLFRNDALCKMNIYVRLMDKRRFSLMTKIDMFLVSHLANGYVVDRHVVNLRKRIKSLIKQNS